MSVLLVCEGVACACVCCLCVRAVRECGLCVYFSPFIFRSTNMMQRYVFARTYS